MSISTPVRAGRAGPFRSFPVGGSDPPTAVVPPPVVGCDNILTGTYAALPAAGTDGRLYLPSDGVQMYRDNGISWLPWGALFQFTAPVLTDYTWVNQGGATANQTYGGVRLYAPAAGGTSLRILKKSAPSVPYTITLCVMTHAPKVDYQKVGFVWRQSSDGKLMTAHVTIELSAIQNGVGFIKYSDPTTISAAYGQVNLEHWGPVIWFRCQDDGVDRISDISMDGQHWQEILSVGRTDFLTADEVGFFANAENATWGMEMVLLHWEEA